MILRRLMAIFTTMTIVAFSLLGTLLYSFVGRYAVNDKKQTLISLGNEISSTAEHIIHEDFENYAEFLNISFDLLARNMNCEIFMADKNGKVLLRTFLKYPDERISNIPNCLFLL